MSAYSSSGNDLATFGFGSLGGSSNDAARIADLERQISDLTNQTLKLKQENEDLRLEKETT